jgi:antitoxin component YwqK of YwqJK toxin-antitoxin module
MGRNLIKTLFLIYLLSSFNFSNAQTSIITKYYDSSWIEVPRESALFVGEFERSDSVYLFTSYWMKSKKIQSRGVFKDTLFQKATKLLHKFYESGQTADSIYLANDGNTIFHYHFYENGKLDFKKFYRTNNNLDSAYHYYTNGNLYVHYFYDSKRVNEIVDAYDKNGKKIKDFYYGKDAEFPGGSSAWISFLQNNIRTRVHVKNGARSGHIPLSSGLLLT